MKNVLFFLFLVGFSTSCKKTDTPDPGLINLLLKIQMTNGDVIYASPVINSTDVEWGPVGTNIADLPNTTSEDAANMDFNGESNTTAIVARLGTNNGMAYAAKVCADLVAYGFDDWYLPAAGELNEMYKKLGPVANGGSGQITTGNYWSSSERSETYAWNQDFDDGSQSSFVSKDYYSQCRCIRR